MDYNLIFTLDPYLRIAGGLTPIYWFLFLLLLLSLLKPASESRLFLNPPLFLFSIYISLSLALISIRELINRPLDGLYLSVLVSINLLE